MAISPKDLEQIAALAYLDMNQNHAPQLMKEVNEIMNFVDQLRSVDTKGIEPLFHPFDMHQRLRPDLVTEEDCLAELEALAPMFEDNFYLVPQVLDQDK